MKKIYLILIAASITSAILLSGCKKALDKQALTAFNTQQIFADSTIAVLYMNTIYTNNLPVWYGSSGSTSTLAGVGFGNLTEENRSDNIFVKGQVTQENVGDIGSSNSNSTNYGKIRAINDFISNMSSSPIPLATKRRFTAQCLFWRAYRYFELVKLYGGVPLVLTPLPVVGTAAKTAADVPRSTTTQTYNQIVADLDTAIKYLPAVWSQVDYGRITKGAAQAFLGRVLLTWASPQFNTNNDMTRWQAAYDASTAAISTLSSHGWGLYPKEDVTMWTTEGAIGSGAPQNSEAVMVTEFNTSNDQNGMDNNGYTKAGVPSYLSGSGGNNPTWDEVQAFPMADGKTPGNSTKYTYDPVHFFDNRDPRFYQTIAYNGCLWPLEGNTNYRLWTYYYYTNTAGTASKSTESSASSTGFYCRKAIDPTLSGSNLVYSGTDWQEIRYAEVLLNQAEAAAELGHLGVGQEAYSNLIAVRKRAGIEAGSDGLYGLQAGMDHDAMINAIMYERQIEFAYEGKRYWDLRRRKLLESTLNGKMRQGLSIILKPNGSNSDYFAALNSAGVTLRDAAANTSLDNVYTTYFSAVPMVLGTSSVKGEIKNVDTYPIAYQTADYFFGIPTASIQNNPALLQNNTWGGAFNPLQ